ncbi:MAG: hypothetical protein V3U60_09000 [Gammaproteobacteria bacterium]
MHANIFSRYVGAENYKVVTYLSTPPSQATLANLLKEAPLLGSVTGDGFYSDVSILILVTHGDKNGITVEECDNETDCKNRLDAYKKQVRAELANELNWVVLEREGHSISVSPKFLNAYFGGTELSRSMVMVFACSSLQMQTENSPTPFGNYAYFGCPDQPDDKEISKILSNLFRRLGGHKDVSHRSISRAWDPTDPIYQLALGKSHIQLVGGSALTLAPAVTNRVPPPHFRFTTLPTPWKSGWVKFDTKMDTTTSSIVSLDGCTPSFKHIKWGSSTTYKFKFKLEDPGMLTLTVNPQLATSDNNDNKLIGNRYDWKANENTFVSEVFEPKTPPFGLNGFDGIKPYPPPDNSYRWVCWCGERVPPSPNNPGEEKKDSDPQDAGKPIDDYIVPSGEKLAFVLYENESATVQNMYAIGPGGGELPANFTFNFPADPMNPWDRWYAHVIFSPTSEQEGMSYEVTFETRDSGGAVIHSQPVVFQVVAPTSSSHLLTDDELEDVEPDLAAFRPGDDVEYRFSLINTGNTQLEDITLTAGNVSGPVPIDASAVTIEPSYVEILHPGKHLFVNTSVATQLQQQTGYYTGNIDIQATSSQGSGGVGTRGFDFHLNHVPEINVSDVPTQAYVGSLVSMNLTGFDADGDDLSFSMELIPSTVTLSSNGNNVTFEWTPGPKGTGSHSFPLIAHDDVSQAAYDLLIDVEGPINLEAIPVEPGYDLGQPAPLEIAYVNRNSVAARLSESIQVYADEFDGALRYSHVNDLGELASGGVILNEFAIPTHPSPQVGLAVRITANTSINESRQFYSDVAEFYVQDCNSNSIFDSCDINCGSPEGPCDVPGCGTSNDLNSNTIPDDCEPDCNDNGTPDDYDIYETISFDCTGNGIPDECERDCNDNDIADSCDIEAGTSEDCDENELPDECERDCNGNEIADACDISAGTSMDLDENGVPDECDTGPGACCLPDASCQNLVETEGNLEACNEAGGFFFPHLTCGEVSCPFPPNDLCESPLVVCEDMTPSSSVGHCDNSDELDPGPVCSRPQQDCYDGSYCLQWTHGQTYRCLVTTDNRLASTDGPRLDSECVESDENHFQRDVWYKITAPCSGDLVIDMCNAASQYDSMLAVYGDHTGDPQCPVASNADLRGCNDDFCLGDGKASAVQAHVYKDAQYLIRLGGFSPTSEVADAGQDISEMNVGFLCSAIIPVLPPALPADPVHRTQKNRYISIDSTANESRDVALQVTLSSMKRCSGDLSRACTDHDDCETAVPGSGTCIEHADVGSAGPWWVQAPQQEPLGCIPGPCGDDDWFARVDATPYFDTWTLETLHVGDCEVIPVASYEIRACLPPDGAVCSEPLTIGTIAQPFVSPGFRGNYGDVAGPVDPFMLQFTPPNGFTNVIDVSAYTLTKQNYGTPNRPQTHPTWVDLHGLGDGNPPQYILNVSDLGQILKAFAGDAWTDDPGNMNPGECP